MADSHTSLQYHRSRPRPLGAGADAGRIIPTGYPSNRWMRIVGRIRGWSLTRRLVLVLLATALLNALPAAWASDLPLNYQALFLLRVLAYDRHLKSRAGDAVNVVIVYREGD